MMLPLSYPDIACWLIGTLKIYCSFVAMIFYGRTIRSFPQARPTACRNPKCTDSFGPVIFFVF